MVNITPQVSAEQSIIQQCNEDGLVISGERFSGDVCIYPTTALALEDALDFSNLETLITADTIYDFILIGTGASFKRLTADQTAQLKKISRGIEVMDTKAACRSFNVLNSEGRHFIALMKNV